MQIGVAAKTYTRDSERRSPNAFVALLVLFTLWFILCRQLSSEWSVNDQYGYGWFVPFFALFLFWLRWEDRPMEGRAPSRPNLGMAQSPSLQVLAWIFIGIPALLLLLPVRVFEIGNPDWRPLSWLHAAAVTTLTLLYVWHVGGVPWVRHFAFPILFVFVAVPWVSPVEVPIVQGLMRVVAGIASEAATLCGIPTQLEGSLIRIPNGLVGINEACSGVRSLQTSLMIGLLFGELRRLSILRRVAIVAGALAIAFIGNCTRAFFLVWIAATKNIAAVDRWHDTAGYAIVAAVFAGSMILAILLGRKNRPAAVVAGVSPANMEGLQPARLPLQRQKSEARDQFLSTSQRSSFLLSPSYFLLALCWLVFVEAASAAWYRSHERNLTPLTRWTVRWPESAPNFRDVHIDPAVQSTLRYNYGRQAAWLAPQLAPSANAQSAPICSMSFFRWNAGGTSILRARSHRPDICLPNEGWQQISDHGVRNYAVADQFALPFRHFSFARSGPRQDPSRFAEAFFCMREDFFRPGEQQFDLNRRAPSNWMLPDRWHAIRSGLRNPGQQVLELVFISSRALDPATVEERFAKDIQHVIVVNPAAEAGTQAIPKL